jgi:hypothetical protein
MATLAATSPSAAAATHSASYERFAGACAILAGLIGLVYSIAFVVLQNQTLYSAALLAAGLLGTAALVAVYNRVRETDASFALLGLLLGVIGGLGAAIHGGYDLANALHPPAVLNQDLPSAIDPRGLLTFGVAGLGMWALAWLIVRGGQLPRGLGVLGYVLAALLIIIYLARLIVLSATSPVVLVPALLAGFLVNPLWYVWLGAVLVRKSSA